MNRSNAQQKQTKNARKKAQRGKRRVRKAVPQSQGGPQAASAAFRLSPCAEKYYDSLLDPFDGPADACVPVLPSFPSQKVRVFARGSATTSSTTNVGFVLVRPSITSDGIDAAVTAGPYTGTTLASSGTGVTQVGMANSPFTVSDFTSSGSVQSRCVSAGIRIRYAGTQQNSGGTVYLLEHPNHGNLVGLSAAQMSAYDRCLREPLLMDGNWRTLCWAPVDTDEFDYATAGTPAGGTGFCLAIMVISAASGAQFDYEIFANWEVIGSKARGLTENRADPQGMSLVQQAVRSVANGQIDSLALKPGKTVRSHKGIGQVLGNLAKNVLTGFIPKALPLISALL